MPKIPLFFQVLSSVNCDLVIIKIYVRIAAGRAYSLFHLYMCVCMYGCLYLCHDSWPNKKRYRPLYTYFHTSIVGWAKILLAKCLGCQKLSLGSLLTKKKFFFWKNVKNPATYSGVEISRLPLKFPFLKIFKIIVESSLIAHLIGNFILKNIKAGHFW